MPNNFARVATLVLQSFIKTLFMICTFKILVKQMQKV